jgi:hypothetical protein
MDWFLKKHVSELNLAENHLVQVLLSEFVVNGNGHRAHLHVRFDGKTPAIRRRESKEVIRKAIPKFKGKAKRLQDKLDKLLLDHTSSEFVLCRDDNFVFRYASAGVLPILSMDGIDYYCLFYRDVEPIGWNIANGGCDSIEELLDPLHTMLRELQEELMIFDFHNGTEHLFSYRSRSPADLLEFQAARRFWQQMFPNVIFADFKKSKANIEWIDGPDTLSICFSQDQPRNIPNCFVNINAIDFGIEIDKIAKISVGRKATILDGEIINNSLLRCPIGLFEVNKLSHPIKQEQNFFPDRLFYDGIEREKGELYKMISDEFWPRLLNPRNPIRSVSGKKRWANEKFKYKFCPVTKALVHRHRCCASTSATPEEIYDVFISYSSEDKDIVLCIIEDLKKMRISYWVDHEQIMFGDFITEKIEDGLQRSRFVLVCLSVNLGRSNWCKKEYGPIINRNCKNTSTKKVLPLKLDNVKDDDIPILLYDIHRADYDNKKEYYELLNFIKSN